MSQMQIRGSTQIKDLSIPINKLSQEVQDMLTAVSQRFDFIATIDGQTVVTNAGIDATLPILVYRNGQLLSQSDYAVGTGEVTFSNPTLYAGETVAVFVQGTESSAGADLAASPPLPLPTVPATDKILIIRSGQVYSTELQNL